MKPSILVSTILFAAFGPSTEACTQKYIEWEKTKGCSASQNTLNAECYTIMKNMRSYSNSHGKLWGGDFSADNKVACGVCGTDGKVGCICKISAWRFREWMYDPGPQYWPKMPSGWSRVDPSQVPNGWIDTVSPGLACF